MANTPGTSLNGQNEQTWTGHVKILIWPPDGPIALCNGSAVSESNITNSGSLRRNQASKALPKASVRWIQPEPDNTVSVFYTHNSFLADLSPCRGWQIWGGTLAPLRWASAVVLQRQNSSRQLIVEKCVKLAFCFFDHLSPWSLYSISTTCSTLISITNSSSMPGLMESVTKTTTRENPACVWDNGGVIRLIIYANQLMMINYYLFYFLLYKRDGRERR